MRSGPILAVCLGALALTGAALAPTAVAVVPSPRHGEHDPNPSATPTPSPSPSHDPAAYQRGYQDGLAEGRARGFDEGHRRGHFDGEVRGRNEGRHEGHRRGEVEGHRDGHAAGEPVGRAEGESRGQRDGAQKGEADGRARRHQEGKTDGYNKGYAEGYQAGANSDAYQRGHAKGTQEGERIERERGLREGRTKGYADREAQIRREVRDALGVRAHEGHSLSVTVASGENPDARRARLASHGSNSSYDEGRRAGYNQGYKESYDRAYHEAYHRSYHLEYARWYREAYNESYNEAYERGRQDGYNYAYQRWYQAAYQRAYDDAYNRDYPEEYRRGYEEGFGRGRLEGYARGYDDQFQAGYRKGFGEASARVYPPAYQEGYQRGVAQAQQYYDTHAVVELDDVLLEDSGRDGTYTAGEEVLVKATAINYGSLASSGQTLTLATDDPLARVLAPRTAVGQVPGRRRRDVSYAGVAIDPQTGMNVPFQLTFVLEEGEREQGSRTLRILVLNPNSRRYQVLTFALGDIDRAREVFASSSSPVPAGLATAREWVERATQVSRLDTNPQVLEHARSAVKFLDRLVIEFLGSDDPLRQRALPLVSAADNTLKKVLR